MDDFKSREENVPFYEIKQRYCSKLDGNVVLKRELGTDGAFTCMSSHLCSEDCRSREDKKNAAT